MDTIQADLSERTVPLSPSEKGMITRRRRCLERRESEMDHIAKENVMLLRKSPVTNPAHPEFGTYGIVLDPCYGVVSVNNGLSEYGLSLDMVQVFLYKVVRRSKAHVAGQPKFSYPKPRPVVKLPAKKTPSWLTRAGRWLAGFGM